MAITGNSVFRATRLEEVGTHHIGGNQETIVAPDAIEESSNQEISARKSKKKSEEMDDVVHTQSSAAPYVS